MATRQALSTTQNRADSSPEYLTSPEPSRVEYPAEDRTESNRAELRAKPTRIS